MSNNTTRLLAFLVQDPARKTALQSVCIALDITYVPVEASDFKTPLGLLAGLSGLKLQACPEMLPPQQDITEEMIVMYGMDEDLLNRFLAQCRKNGCSISLKAVLTKTNAYWNAGMLQYVLMQERQEILAQIKKNNTERSIR